MAGEVPRVDGLFPRVVQMNTDQELQELCDHERQTLTRLALDIVNCCESLEMVVKEAHTAAKRELFSLNKGEPYATIQVTPLQDSSTEKLMARIAEYNARLLWRKAVKRIIDT